MSQACIRPSKQLIFKVSLTSFYDSATTICLNESNKLEKKGYLWFCHKLPVAYLGSRGLHFS